MTWWDFIYWDEEAHDWRCSCGVYWKYRTCRHVRGFRPVEEVVLTGEYL